MANSQFPLPMKKPVHSSWTGAVLGGVGQAIRNGAGQLDDLVLGGAYWSSCKDPNKKVFVEEPRLASAKRALEYMKAGFNSHIYGKVRANEAQEYNARIESWIHGNKK